MRLICILILLFSFSNILACTCGTIPDIDEQEMDKAKEIFIGEVIKVESTDDGNRKVTFKITERLKASITTEIFIFTGLGDADCGLKINEGEKWYIFTYNNNGKSWAGRCGRSALLSGHAISNPNKKFYRKAVRQYKLEKNRVRKEIRYVRKTRHNIN